MRPLILCLLGGTAAFLTLDHAIGSSITSANAGVRVEQINLVDRSSKGDRLPAVQQPVTKAPATKPESRMKPKLPDGCEPMVSPLTGQPVAHLPGRCVA